jgi:DNA-binding CsgD family transcriptional regulator
VVEVQFMRTIENLSQLISDVGTATSPRAVWPLLKTFVEQFGVTHISVFDKAPDGDNVIGDRLFSDGGIDFGDSHATAPNPLILAALQSKRPVAASELLSHGLVLGRWQESFRFIAKQGDALALPIVGTNGTEGLAILSGPIERMSAMSRSLVQIAVHLAFKRATQLNTETAGAEAVNSNLSARQAECLQWVAQGKTDPEIGIILGVSPRTVRFHLDKAKDKLKVMTRVQAVTKAVKDRLIAA